MVESAFSHAAGALERMLTPQGKGLQGARSIRFLDQSA